MFGEDFDAGTNARDDGGANVDHLQRRRTENGTERAIHEAVDLAAVGIPLHRDVQEPERGLAGIGDLARQEDRSRARPEEGAATAGEVLKRLEESLFVRPPSECRRESEKVSGPHRRGR